MLILLGVHWIVPRLRRMNSVNDAILNSIGSGLALGFVFLHMIPDFINNVSSLKQQAYSNFLQDDKNLLFVIFLFVLGGFCVWYWLEKLAHDRTKKGEEAGFFIYSCHIGMMTFTSFSVTALMYTIGNESIFGLILFTLIMAFHFILEDHSLSHHFPKRFKYTGRYLIMLGVLSGWLFSLYTNDQTQTLVTTFMNAFLAGTLILATAKTEFSLLEGKSHFPTFLASLITKAFIVFIILLLENIG
jgi:hypothetical protein